ncbi:MAG: hypothetical protein COX49_09330 [bacterium (Candidatus Stahlbacteria) CG23_combo_of_CG06-09_8_20_14_all_40_9]|nr:MAG: hypothetical protein COX49_09330 [bacterium (Candidatus Stahlbacteria) CG23_combo_of_CG06-09_8_20_14_all_40_9]
MGFKGIFLIVLILSQIADNKAMDKSKQLFEMTNQEIDSLLTETSQKDLTISERINFYSEKFLGTPYNFQCVGDGPYALIENWPLVNFQETNCMALCEHVLAMAISDNWDNFFNNLLQIRYKDGIIGMRTRNHYTMADWLPENSWILEDVSRKVGGEYTKSVTRTISHKKFFTSKGIKDMRYVLPDREITIDYIPLNVLVEVEKNIRPGDIVALIYAYKTDVFSAHMLIIAEKNNKKYIREANSKKATTFDTPYKEWASNIQDLEDYFGLSFMRVREELDIPGKVILPWEISKLKSKTRSGSK